MTSPYKVTLLMNEFVTHDVRRFIVSRPDGFTYQPGQGVELAINEPPWDQERRPFTPSSAVDDGVIEFVIKRYSSHQGVTDRLHSLPAGAELLMSDTFGTITYRGPGVFIAGGAGITPFIAILREQARQSALDRLTLIFSNKTPADIICEKELLHYLGKRCILTCTASTAPGYEQRRIDRTFLEQSIDNFNQHFYVCGPPAFTEAINSALQTLGATPQNLVFER